MFFFFVNTYDKIGLSILIMRVIRELIKVDIYFRRDHKVFNFRVAAIIKKDNKVLISKFNDYYTLPGGRVQFGETTETALRRELFEELNIQIKIERLISINENFFNYGNDLYHEVLFTYLCEVSEEIDLSEISHEHESYHFMHLHDLLKTNLKPEFLLDDLKQLPLHIHHNVNK